MCGSLIKCKIAIMDIVITIIYKSIFLLIQFIVSTINIYISVPHCSHTATKYPHRSFSSMQSIHYRSKMILSKETSVTHRSIIHTIRPSKGMTTSAVGLICVKLFPSFVLKIQLICVACFGCTARHETNRSVMSPPSAG